MPQYNWSQFSGAQYVNNLPGGAPNVGDLMYHAFRIAGIMGAAGRPYSDGDFQDALWELNMMLSVWQAQQNLVWAYPRTVFNINVGQGGTTFPYLVGLDTTNGVPDILIPRPERIEWAGYVFTNSNPATEQPFKMLTAQEWAALSPKDLSSGNPTQFYYQPDVPNGKIFLFPVPAQSYVTKGTLYTWQTVSSFATPLDPVITPPAYVDAMTYGLAARLILRFSNRATGNYQAIAGMAGRTLAIIKSLNEPNYIQQVERGCQGVGQSRGNWNILSNQYVP